MSHDPSDKIKPQPGAVPGAYLIRVCPNQDISHPGWPTLPAKDSPNFAFDDYPKPVRIIKAEKDGAWIIKDADDRVIDESKSLYRVWGEPAYDIGRYWTDEAPESEKDFYGNTAVALSWNSGRYLAQLKNAGLITEIRGWRGTIAPQPADGMNRQTLPDYHLPGGLIQYFIPDALPWIAELHTKWNPAKQPHVTIPTPALQVAPPGKGTVADGSHYQALADLVDYLAHLLVEEASTQGAEFGFRTSSFTGQAAILDAKKSQLGAADAAANADSRLIAQSLVPIARYLDGYPEWGSDGDAIRGAIENVVKWAYAIAVEAT